MIVPQNELGDVRVRTSANGGTGAAEWGGAVSYTNVTEGCRHEAMWHTHQLTQPFTHTHHTYTTHTACSCRSHTLYTHTLSLLMHHAYTNSPHSHITHKQACTHHPHAVQTQACTHTLRTYEWSAEWKIMECNIPAQWLLQHISTYIININIQYNTPLWTLVYTFVSFVPLNIQNHTPVESTASYRLTDTGMAG